MAKKEVITLDLIDDSEDEQRTYGLSEENLIEKDSSAEPTVIDTTEEKLASKRKRGPGRPPKDAPVITYTNIVDDEDKSSKKGKNAVIKELEKGYSDTGKMLYETIAQSDMIYTNIDEELAQFKRSKMYGGKMRLQHMSNFMGVQMGILNTKISAVRELDAIRNKINDIALKKEQMMKDVKDENSDKVITDAYYAMLNAPKYGLPMINQPLAPQSINTGVNLSGSKIETSNVGTPGIASTNISLTDIVTVDGSTANIDTSFNQYRANLSPVQRKMISEKDPSIQTVVVYNQATGSKYFDVVNVQTGQSIPGIERPAEFLLDNMRIDQRNGRAVNSNANMDFPLVITGTRAFDEL